VPPSGQTQAAVQTSNTPCPPYSTGCQTDYLPYVAWSVPYVPQLTLPGVTFVSYTRPCGPVGTVWNIKQNENSLLSLATFMSTLRVGGIVYPDPILVADVSYTEKVASFPLNFFTGGQLTFIASAYWPVRVIPFNANTSPVNQIGSGELTTYDLANQDPNTGAHCAGYP
jgi:hypothetical protein